ncbi:MAG TPA: bifunctional demethylmenaquinone methyltransferase/2-methoxy-6-polyprenyl-1,4-benzoquinol methylase UbiE [Phycisphaerae bacterium]
MSTREESGEVSLDTSAGKAGEVALRRAAEGRDVSRVWDAERLANPHRQPDKSSRVRRMFDEIAPTYERVNTVCSAGRDARWRRTAVALARVAATDAVLDVACGTGDLARAFAQARGGAARPIVGCDFSRNMLERARRSSAARFHWCQADAQRLPFADNSFQVIGCAFGVRNFQALDVGLAEMYRVAAPGGRVVILEFTRPRRRLIRTLYEFYTTRLMPLGAALLSGDRSGAYRYLPRSVVSFLDAEQMTARLRAAGFVKVEYRPLTFGAVTVYLAIKG